DHIGRPRDPRSVEHVDLRRVAELHLVLELVLEPFVAVSPLLDQRHLVAVTVAQQAAGEVRPDLAAACDEDVHALGGDGLACRDLAGARGVQQLADRGLRRADRTQAERAVEVGPSRIEDAHDDTLVVEPLHRHLGDDEVRVVAVGGDDDCIGVFDTRLAQDVDVHAVAEHEAAAPVLTEARKRLLFFVDPGDFPAFLGKLERHVRPHSAAADHECLHALTIAHVVAYAGSSSSSSRTPCGKATTSTSQGAFFKTYSTVGEKKRDCRRHFGAEPTTIKSTPSSFAWLTIASPIERARTVFPLTSTPWSSPSISASAKAAVAFSSSSTISSSMGRSIGTRMTWSAQTEAPDSCASLTAVATISSPIGPSFSGTRMLEYCASVRSTCSSAETTRRVSRSPRDRRSTTYISRPAASQAGPP